MAQDNQILIAIEQLVDYATKKLSLDKYDVHYVRNALLDNFKLGAPITLDAIPEYDIQDTMDFMVNYAIEQGFTTVDDAILYETKLFGLVTPAPSSIIMKYDITEAVEGVEAATDYLFELGKANNYLRMKDINKNVMWEYEGSKGGLVVTINLSKPEKNPKPISSSQKTKKGKTACKQCT